MTGNSTTARAVLAGVIRLALGIGLICTMLFLPAGTLDYWQAWTWLAALFLPMLVSLVYLVGRDPVLLERRMRTNETRAAQKRIIGLSAMYFLIVFLLPGFDKRFGWSSVPAWVSLLADAVVVAAYVLYILVLNANRYASRVIEVESNQRIVTTGPYALVRHPMYLAMILMMSATPLALGSYWAFIPALALIPLLAARAKNEEELLIKDLAGYREYMQKTPYRLFPGVW